ncbi:hypothetical protein SDRG_13645 [Saprolegnia diclina VS20]|uniref:EF-hand domain-containing protein n=1 Tax=Saprolegnia diclina (strain VS20) TaxID=1156394 RepID=T0RFW3_SAPDV|nr:hypothetical protein SDRG_13645 [Saprolegnia diclina VS20]EQC28567.1 hypothetical protein SDRG_13645 [Saprolegnia diclina VS20]|eukprot:XP_008617964.1 hypothetical protein SDRG_13645 [Saprolegnia diclina VS20]
MLPCLAPAPKALESRAPSLAHTDAHIDNEVARLRSLHIADVPRMSDLSVFRVRRDALDVSATGRSTLYTLQKARLEMERRRPASFAFALPPSALEPSPRPSPRFVAPVVASPRASVQAEPRAPMPTQESHGINTSPRRQHYHVTYRANALQAPESVCTHNDAAHSNNDTERQRPRRRRHVKSTRQPQLSCPLPINPIDPRDRLLQLHDISEFDLRVCHSPRAVTAYHGHLSDYNLEELMAKTGFTRLELYTLWSRFKALCSLSRSPAGVDQATFRRAVPLLSVEDEMFVDRVFAILDDDYSGVIEWREFIRAMSALEKGDLRARIVFLFEVYDLNGDEKLSRDELMAFFISGLMVSSDDKNVQDMAQHFADEILLALGVTPAEGATISIPEVAAFIEKAEMEDIYSIFGRTMLNELDKQTPKPDADLALVNETLETTSIVYRMSHTMRMDNV